MQPVLFSPLPIRDFVLRNRITVSPMCQYSAQDGFSNEWHLVHLGSRAVGGAGLVFTEATAVAPEGRISPNDLGIWKDDHISGLQKIVDFIHTQGAIAGIQLAHAGRKASVTSPWQGNRLLTGKEGGWDVLAPSGIAFNDRFAIPKALSLDQIKQLVDDFGAAATRALKSGFRVIEVHAAHGYLIHEFLSPLSNKREDEYGGSLENRMRLLIEIVRAVRKQWPASHALFVRISASEWTEGGWSVEDSVALARILKNEQVDLVDCSSGGNVSDAKIPVGPGYQVPFAMRVKKEAGIQTGAVGMIMSAAQAESILASGEADLIFLARELLRDPYFPLRAARELGYTDITWPLQYERAKI